jgi:hypothetical protein
MNEIKMNKPRDIEKEAMNIPTIDYGTSFLGNLYRELTYTEKTKLMQEWFKVSEPPVMIDTVGSDVPDMFKGNNALEERLVTKIIEAQNAPAAMSAWASDPGKTLKILVQFD